MPVAWLSLDEADNDLTRFLTYLIAALQRTDAGIGVDIQAALAAAQAPLAGILLTRLVADIAGWLTGAVESSSWSSTTTP